MGDGNFEMTTMERNTTGRRYVYERENGSK
jgi:hypothetical protein